MHNFKYALKVLLKNKMLLFWTFAFPILLGTFFSMAFSKIEEEETFHSIPIAIIENEEFKENKFFQETFKALGDEANSTQVFTIFYTEEEKANELLKNGDITGFILFQEQPKLVVRKNGIEETIVKFVTEEVLAMENVLETLVTKKITEKQKEIPLKEEWFTSLYNEIIEQMSKEETYTKDISKSQLSYTMIEYYTLIAMTCLYGGILGMVSITNCLANKSSKGKRTQMSPTPKSHFLLSSIGASFLMQLLGLFFLFLYTKCILHVEYGNSLSLVILLAVVGSLAGLSLGVGIACMFKTNENTKIGILISITMLGCFLSGMMGITMKYVVDTHVPILNKINPANMITDGFYALYYYDTYDRYVLNVGSLLLFSGILFSISLIHLRRQRYDTI